jgi:hypothetical protein
MEAQRPCQEREDIEKTPASEDLMASLVEQVPDEAELERSERFKRISKEVSYLFFSLTHPQGFWRIFEVPRGGGFCPVQQLSLCGLW